jgi:hypothetical protein
MKARKEPQGFGHAEVLLLYDELREDRKMEVVNAVRSAGSLPKPGDAYYFRWKNLLHSARNYREGPGHAEALSLYDELREDMKVDREMEVVNAVRSAGFLPKPGDEYYRRWKNLLHSARNDPELPGHAEALALYDDLCEDMDSDRKEEVVKAVGSAGCLPKPGDAYYSRWNTKLHLARNYLEIPGQAEALSSYDDFREVKDSDWKNEVGNAVRSAGSFPKPGDAHYLRWNEREGPGHLDALLGNEEVRHLPARSRREGGVKRKGKVRFGRWMRRFPKYADAEVRYLNFLREKETFPLERRRFRGSGVGELWNESYVAEWRRRRYRFVKDDELSKAERALDLRLIHEIADFWEASFVWPSDKRLVEYMKWRSVYYVSVLS